MTKRISLQKLFGSATEIWRMGNWLMYRMPDGSCWFRWQARAEETQTFSFRIS